MAANWECPSLPMLSFPMKESGRASFLGIKPMISAQYEEDPESFREEIRQLDQLREHAIRPPRDYGGCSVLRRYFAQLHLLRARFPPEIGQLPIDFAWKDAFSSAEYIQEGLQIEQASVLYNLAALHSQLGCHGRRDNEQEMKEAVTHFQCAAGAITYLEEHFAVNHASKDLSPQFVALYKNLMLGQAQECLVEKSLKGVGRVKSITISKLAARVTEYYIQVSRSLEVEPCNIVAKKYKDWTRLLKVKMLYFQAVSHFFQGANAEEMGKHGEMIGYHQLALHKLSAIGKIQKSLGEVVKEAVKNLSEHLQANLQVSKKQNDQVYHDIVPVQETLEATQGADLVKPVSFHPVDPKSHGTDILARLVPMRAYEVASVFSEEAAKLQRSVVSSVQEKDEELEQFLTSLNISEINKLHAGPPEIPSEVRQQHKLLEGKRETINKLHRNMQELMSLSGQVSEDLEEVATWRKEDTEEEEEFRAKFGTRPAAQVCATLWRDLENYQAYHSQASKSNSELKAMFDQHYQNLMLLTGPLSMIEAAVPKMTLMDTPAEDAADIERWKELLGKVDQMKKQRSTLLFRLREQISSDDITKVLIGHLGVDQDTFIEEHMKKHREIADVIRQNLTAQEKILTALTEANAKHAGTRQAAQEMSKQQEGLFKSLVKSGSYLPLVQSKIQEGVGFYTRLHENVTKLKKRTTEVCNTRRRERQGVQRQSATPPPPPPPADQDQSEPAHPPMRPPKKAELSGRPLPPEQQKLPPKFPPTDEPDSLVSDQSQQPASSAPTSQQPSSLAGGIPSSKPAGTGSQLDMDHQLQELQRMHELQMQQLKHAEPAMLTLPSPTQSVPQEEMQQAPQQQQDHVLPHDVSEAHQPQQQTMPATGELLAPTQVQPHVSEGQLPGGPQAGTTQPQLLPSNARSQQQAYGSMEPLGELQQPGEVVEGSLFHLQGDTTPGAVPEASQALLNLQMLLQPPGVTSQPPPTDAIHPVHPAESSPDRQEFNEEEHLPHISPIPQRPPKPHHLQSKPKQPSPSPAPSSQISASGSQVSTPGSEVRTLPPPQPPSDQWLQRDDEPATLLIDPYKPTPFTGGGEQVSSSPSVVPGHMQIPNQFPPPSIPQHIPEQTTPIIPHQEDRVWLEEPMGPPPQERGITLSAGFIPLGEVAPQPGKDVNLPPPGAGENTVTVDSFSRPIPAVQNPIHSESMHVTPEVQPVPLDGSVPLQEDVIPEPKEVISLEPPPSESLLSRQIPPPSVQSSTVVSSTIPPPATSSQEPFEQLAAEAFAGLSGSIAADKILPVTSAVEDVPTLADPTHISEAISNDHTGSETSVEIAPQITAQPTMSLPSRVSLTTSHELPSVSLGLGSIPPLPTLNSTGIDTNLASLPVSVYQPIAAPLSLPTPPSASPLPQELSASLFHSLQPANTAHFEALLSSQQDTIREQSRQVEQQNQHISDQKTQIEDHMQQILILQQQIAQLSMQQHKQEQDKVASSGQQAVLMQLLQQQQGMFSQQQSHIEKLSQVGESHRKEQMELEIKYKQALAVEQEQKSSLQNQVMQQNQEVQKLQQQLQSQAQQYQSLQFQLHQYSTQIQERDKQLIAFRDQHKQIVQNLEQRHQQKVEQLMEHMQKLQAEVKRNRVELQRQQQMQPPGGGLPPPLQPVQAIPLQPQSVQPPGANTPQALHLQMLLPQQVQPADLPNQPPQQPILQPTRVSPQPQLHSQLPPVHSQGAAVPHRPPQRQSQQQQPPSQQQPSPQQLQPPPQQHQPSPQQLQPSPQHQPLPQQHQPLPQQHQPLPQQHQPLPQQHQPSPQQHQPSPQQHQPSPQQHQPSPQQHQPSPQIPQWEGQQLPQRRDMVHQQQQPFIQAATNQPIQPTQQPQLPSHSQTLQTPQGQLPHPVQPHVGGPHLAGQPLGPRMVPTHSQTHPGLSQGIPQKSPIQTPGSLPPPSPQQPTGPYSQVRMQQPVQQFQPPPLNIPPGQTFPQQPSTPSGPALQPRIAGAPANFAPHPQQQMLMQQPSRGPTSSLNFQVPSSQGFQPPKQQ